MAYKPAGNPCDNFREQMLLNSGSFSTSANADSDVFRETAITSGMPARTSHTTDSTAYGTQPKTDNWLSRCRWGWSPANTNTDGQAGSQT
jgi:hypothetical protein